MSNLVLSQSSKTLFLLTNLSLKNRKFLRIVWSRVFCINSFILFWKRSVDNSTMYKHQTVTRWFFGRMICFGVCFWVSSASSYRVDRLWLPYKILFSSRITYSVQKRCVSVPGEQREFQIYSRFLRFYSVSSWGNHIFDFTKCESMTDEKLSESVRLIALTSLCPLHFWWRSDSTNIRSWLVLCEWCWCCCSFSRFIPPDRIFWNHLCVVYSFTASSPNALLIFLAISSEFALWSSLNS